MEDPRFTAMRGIMLREIAANVQAIGERIGKSGFDIRVLNTMGKVPRHEFVPVELRDYAYLNIPLPIGYGKTISQPFIVALMTDLLDIRGSDRVLEIGTGLGYQAALLAEMAAEVYSIEIIEELANQARRGFKRLGYENVNTRIGNGHHGWPEEAPFDKIIVTAAPDLIPPSLLGQLANGGRMVIPAGLEDNQVLILVAKGEEGRITTTEILPVRFTSLQTEFDEVEGD